MVRIRYTAWDGAQRVRLTPERVFDRFGELLGLTDDALEAIEWLARQGLESDGETVHGLDALLERLREALRERQRGVTLARAFDDVRRRLDELLDRERAAADGPGEEAAARRRALDELPSRLSDALEALRRLGLLDPASARELEELLGSLDDLRDLEEFVRRFGPLFDGEEALAFDEAVALMREMERWRALEASLAAADLGAIDLDLLGELLGPDGVETVRLLQQAIELLWEGGLVTTRGGRVQLSPKGVRRIGQLALREIFGGLLRDRPGAHGTDHRGTTELRLHETRPFVHGEPFALDLVGTLKRSLLRRPGTPLDLRPEDFE